MKTCIICKKEKKEEDFSIEHIVPKALMGSLTMKNVCKKCNSFLGTKVDSIFTNNVLTDHKIYEYKLKSNKNKIKHPLGFGKLVDNGRPFFWGYNENKDESQCCQVNFFICR